MDVPRAIREFPPMPLADPWEAIFGPLRGAAGGRLAVGQIGQSLDGRIATPTGHSHYINGPAGLDHLHRLRSLVDAVLVGAGTAIADDPQLTVRRVAGPSPARVLLDPAGRVPASVRLFADDGVRRLALTAEGVTASRPHGVETVAIRRDSHGVAPADVIETLAQRGLRRVLIEGGADTVSRFIAAGCLDRLHVVVAPIVLGSGRTGISLPPIERADQAMKIPMRVHNLGDEVLFDCDLRSARRPESTKTGQY